MTAQAGALVLIKVGNGATPEVFSTIGGLRISAMKLNNQLSNSSNVASGQWRSLAANGGISSISISGNGLFTDSTSEETLRGYAFSNSINNYQFIFANGDSVTGAFQIMEYERSGEYSSEELYALSLESAGAVTFMSM